MHARISESGIFVTFSPEYRLKKQKSKTQGNKTQQAGGNKVRKYINKLKTNHKTQGSLSPGDKGNKETQQVED